jgi:two-component system cell cycle response regulator DivK
VKQRILVVEDNQLSRELLCDWLETEGYEARYAEDLKTAFAAVQTHQPHAVLLDVQLSDDDGLSLASWIRQQPRLHHIPVIAVTAHAMVTEQQRILQAGCNMCISKPVDFGLLRDQLQLWLAATATSRSSARPDAETCDRPIDSTVGLRGD